MAIKGVEYLFEHVLKNLLLAVSSARSMRPPLYPSIYKVLDLVKTVKTGQKI